MQNIHIGKFSRGLRDDLTAFNIDNDAFPFLFNFYVWRGRVKRKRGTVLLGRLTRQVDSVSGTPLHWQYGTISFTAGVANLLSFVSAPNGASIVPGTINITVGVTTYTDPLSNGVISGGAGGSINYATGVLTLTGVGTTTGTGTFSYYPALPVMGLRDFVTSATATSNNYPLLIAFDTTYAYQCDQEDVNTNFFSVSYYKITNNPVVWSAQDYQQFWSTNYPTSTTNQTGAFWATNNVPGFNFANGSSPIGSGSTTITMNLKSGGVNLTTLIVGDKLWFNEWTTGTINGQVGTVSDVSGAAAGNYVITFASSVTVSGTGIAQLLTNSIPGQDGIRWYDGDMTAQTGIPVTNTTGWVNFAPPLTATTVSINGLPAALYYLVGALAILPFKDRLLFFSPYVQTSTGNPVQLNDTVIWSWNGTPFYNSLVPNNQTFNASAYYVDQTGFGGFLSAGISQPIQTITNNEDVLLIGFGGNGRKTRFAYTGDDIQPFLFYNINSELPSTSTFSSVVLDKGAIDIGSFGICITDQQSSQRIDLDIPNAVFQIQKNNNGNQRVSGIRDYINEWIYFDYPVDNSLCKFPTQAFFFNYRDNTWAIFYENFTTQGHYRANDIIVWATLSYKTWKEWEDPWNTGTESEYEIQVIGGNPQGYVLVKGVGTNESVSGYISAIANDGNGNTQITSYNHCVTNNNPNTLTTDFIYIEGCLGSNFVNFNNKSYAVIEVIDANNFVIDTLFPGTGYLGSGQFRRLSQPIFQTKQFPLFWDQGRQVRLGRQQYLLTKTADGQVTLNIYLSQDDNDPWNDPNFAGTPNGLIYTQTLLTSLEANNLQSLVGQGQQQIWHRVNTSLKGDTFQVSITLSDTQMLDIDSATDEIELHAMNFNVSPGPLLA
jgi:hypothetical protein